MKRVFKIFALVFTFVLVLCSCDSDPALKIGKSEIDTGVYSYFLDSVYINEGKEKKLSDKEIKKKATDLCVRYVKINTKFNDMKLSIPASTKASIATEVNNNWDMYGGYYSSIGVSKNTLTKVYESKAYKDELLLAIYGKDGASEVKEDKIKDYFKDNYIFFKSINGYLKTDAKTPEERKAVIEKFSSMASSISDDTTIESVYNNYLKDLGQAPVETMDVSVVNKSDKTYSDGFFKQVIEMEPKQTKSIVLNDYIFVVQKYDNFDKELKFYDKYKKDCLINIVSEDFNKKIDSWYKSTKASVSVEVQNDCYNIFVENRNEKK